MLTGAFFCPLLPNITLMPLEALFYAASRGIKISRVFLSTQQAFVLVTPHLSVMH